MVVAFSLLLNVVVIVILDVFVLLKLVVNVVVPFPSAEVVVKDVVVEQLLSANCC